MQRSYFFLLLMLFPIFLSAGVQKHHIIVDGTQRDYYLHLPKHLHSAHPPLLFFLHGGGQRVKKMARRSELNRLSDRYGFIVVYPVGIDKHWSDGRSVTYSGKSSAKVDDVKFISLLIDRLTKSYHSQKVYVTGVSNGGIMTHRLGCELSQKLTAVAPVIANIPKKLIKKCRPKKALPILIMNGTADPIVPWNGGTMRLFKKSMGEVVSTKASVGFWRKQNRCSSKAEHYPLPDTNTKDHSSVTVTRYEQCRDHSEVILYTIKGGGHTLPGTKGMNLRRLVGEKNRDIEGIQVIVDFFLRQ